MTERDLPFYEEYLNMMSAGGGLRVYLAFPDDYIKLLKDNARLREVNASLKSVELKYGQELYRALSAEDKLKYVKRWLDAHNITIPGISW